MIKIIEGNILEAKETVICHQVNCQGVMGAGLAKQIKEKYPENYFKYKIICDRFKSNPKQLLGNTFFYTIYKNNKPLKTIANIFGQVEYGRNKLYTDYKALKQGLIKVCIHAKKRDQSIAIPYGIGCGLAGGNWNIVYKIIEEVFGDYEYDVVIYKVARKTSVVYLGR